jgi:dolichol kinase
VRPSAHAAVSGIISIYLWIHFRSFTCAVVSFLAGVLIDLDHLIDFYTNHRFTLSIKRIYCACLRLRCKRLYIVLHSYELIALLWVAIYAFSLSDIWKAAAIGFTQHIIFDQITNPMTPYGYFITYRILNRFNRDIIIKRQYLREIGACPR